MYIAPKTMWSKVKQLMIWNGEYKIGNIFEWEIFSQLFYNSFTSRDTPIL